LSTFIIPPDFFENLIKSTIALFVVIDPIGNVPLFIALTDKMEKHERKAVSKIAIITAAGLLIVFAIGGTQILAVFGITIFSFMIAGGILQLWYRLNCCFMVHGDLVVGLGKKQQENQE
jgi:small neutral amino acid transporter SnatA (MarC family)